MRYTSECSTVAGWRFDEVRGRNWFDMFVAEHEQKRVRELFGRAVAGERIRGLIPVELDAEGLRLSLTELARSISEVQKLACTFECDSPVEVANNFTATHVYRIAQEAANNTLKHSSADRINIWLSDLNELVTLKLLYNGNGAGENRANTLGMGLRIMAYRAELTGADLNIGQAKTGGAEVVCTVSR